MHAVLLIIAKMQFILGDILTKLDGSELEIIIADVLAIIIVFDKIILE